MSRSSGWVEAMTTRPLAAVGLTAFTVACVGIYFARPASSQPSSHPAHATQVEWWTMAWTGVQAIATSLSVVLLVLTVVFARRAWMEAKRTADTAERTLAEAARSATASETALVETRRLGAIENRAYLSMRKYEGKLTAATQSVEFSFEVPNSGTTPAHDVLITFGGRVCLHSDVNLIDTNDFEETTFYILGGHFVSYAFEIEIPNHDRAAFLSDEVCVGAVVTIHYKDVFQTLEHTLTCRMLASTMPNRKLWVRPCGSDMAT